MAVMVIQVLGVNTTWRTACTVQDFLERAGTTPTFLARYQYCADAE
jgi:hypothetical protein